MTSIPKQHPQDSHSRELPQWLSCNLHQAVNASFERRIVCLPDDALWLDTEVAGVQIRIMEFVPGTQPRLAAQLRLNLGHDPLPMSHYPDLEVLIQQGALKTADNDYLARDYLRLPDPGSNGINKLSVQAAPCLPDEQSVLLYVALGQMQNTDNEPRHINTRKEDLWFPGPVEGTEVLPLHGHGSGNVMLVRWTKTVAFKTRIDPRGEELLVLNGAVYDAQGFYPTNAWIRNPVPAWQSWGARAGTLVYYKNGHFAESAKPDGVNRDGAKPHGAKPHGAKPHGAKPDGAKPHGAKPDGAKPDGAKPHGAKPDGAKPDGAKPDGAKPDSAKPDSANPGSS